jgi:hypothetical protein
MRESPEFVQYSREIMQLFLARGVLREPLESLAI